MSKQPYQSRTLWGLLIAALPQLFSLVGWSGGPDESTAISEALITLLGVGIAVWGRANATRPIAIKPTPLTGVLVLALALLILPFGGCSTTSSITTASDNIETDQPTATATQTAMMETGRILLGIALDYGVDRLIESEPEIGAYIEAARDAIPFDNSSHPLPGAVRLYIEDKSNDPETTLAQVTAIDQSLGNQLEDPETRLIWQLAVAAALVEASR